MTAPQIIRHADGSIEVPALGLRTNDPATIAQVERDLGPRRRCWWCGRPKLVADFRTRWSCCRECEARQAETS